MVRHFLASTFKACTVAAVAIPGLEWLTETTLDSMDVDSVADIEAMAEGGAKTTASLVNGIRTVNDQFANLAAQTGNVIQVNRLAGVDVLTANDFKEDFGIIPKVFNNAFENVPDAVQGALAPEHRGALVTGAVAGGVGMAMLPNVGNEVNYTIRTSAQSAFQAVNQASHAARTGVNNVTGFADRIMEGRTAAPATPAHSV